MSFSFSYFTLIFICANTFIQICFSYQKYKLESYKLCASKPYKKFHDIFSPPEIVLGQGSNSAVIIAQKWNHTNASRIRLSCTFQISSYKSNSEFFIAITKLKFRKTQKGCYDYIQFRDGGTQSEQFCGEIGTDSVKPIFGRRVSFFKVDVHVEKGIASDEELQLEMVITTGNECSSNLDSFGSDSFQCDENDRFSCISKSFIDDGYLNCLPPCRDEGDCIVLATAQTADVSSIALSAITSLVFTMIAVGTCAWLCWKYRACFKKTGSPPSATAPPMELPQMSQDGEETNSQSLPRAQSPEDHPPSYESLFPNK